MIGGSLDVNTNASITEETVQVSKETQLVSSLSLQSFGRLGSSLSLCNQFVVGRGLSAYGTVVVVTQLTLSVSNTIAVNATCFNSFIQDDTGLILSTELLPADFIRFALYRRDGDIGFLA